MKERRETCRASERARDLARENARETMFEVEGGGGGGFRWEHPTGCP
jgi:hypothetical protein